MCFCPPEIKRRGRRAVDAATCLLVLFTLLFGGGHAFAQSTPKVEEVYLFPPDGGVYSGGSTVEVHVFFDRGNLVVTGGPRLVLTIGEHTRYAEFLRVVTVNGEPRVLQFTYAVQPSDRDDDGIGIPANALTLNGGSIKDADGNDAELSHDAVPDDPEAKVNGSVDPAPVLTQIYFNNRPLSGDTFGPGEEIRAFVRFSEPVTVTGNPRLVFRLGDQTRGAELYRAHEDQIHFRHVVEASDLDDDGISIPANAILLNRGSIRDSRGNDADLTHEAVPDDPGRKVDGRLDAVPTITRVWLNRPNPGDTFARGETVIVGVVFSELFLEVAGTPQLTIQVGTQPRYAKLHRRTDSTLQFEYVVQPTDIDTDGISVPADALTLNGGSIKDADGNHADLTHDAVPDDPGRKVNGASGAPTVRRVAFAHDRLPASEETYVAGETIFLSVRFTRGVQVSGSPQFTLQVGSQARRADHLPLLRAAELLPGVSSFHAPGEDVNFLYFQYVVQPSDLDGDGVSAPANALTLNGGSIRAVDDNSDARLSHDGLPDDPRRKVDGSRSDNEAPFVRMYVEQPVRGVFGAGDTITVRLWLNEGVTVTGAPRFALRIGGQTRFATFREIWAWNVLLFDYVVDESDRDDNGLSIAADAVDLNGGTIRDNGGNDADLDLGYLAFSDDPNYKVDGRLTAVPTLPVVGVLALLFALCGGGCRRLAGRL